MMISQYIVHFLILSNLIKVKPFTVHFPYADFHEMLSADILHQLIKGMF